MNVRHRASFSKMVSLLCLLAVSGAAQATVVEWRFQDFVFDDGSTVTGHITVDINGTFPLFIKDFDIETNAGKLSAFSYTPANSGWKRTTPTSLLFSNPSEQKPDRWFGVHLLVPNAQEFAPSLPLSICQLNDITDCMTAVEVLFPIASRRVISGSLIEIGGSVGEVPEPSTTVLLGAGLVLVGLGIYRAKG